MTAQKHKIILSFTKINPPDVALDVQPDEKNAISYVSATDADLQENTKLSYSINTQETCCNKECEPLVCICFNDMVYL